MSCRFAGGAHSPQELWELLRQGTDATSEMPADRWNTEAFFYDGPDAKKVKGTFYARRGAFLKDGIRGFEPEFFRISPREAKHMDPQQRILLELAVEAFEDAGIPETTYKGSETGCYVGLMNHDYSTLQTRESMTNHTSAGSAGSIAANRISFALDLRGPSMVVDTACSSAMVAIHLAAEALRSGSIGMAVCGGISVMANPTNFVALSRIGMIARDGRCKAFDASADGYGRGEGGGLIVLKRLDDALRDGDYIYCELLETGVNSDGRASDGMLAPSSDRHEALLRSVYRKAGIDPRSVGYVEAHGTGTLRGDPVEAMAIGRVLGQGHGMGTTFSTGTTAAAVGGGSGPGGGAGNDAGRSLSRATPLKIGTIKSNIGHTESAAGVAGVLKIALCAAHGELVPSLHYRTPNPNIPFDELGLQVQTRVEPVPDDFIAGCNSFGFGGTNAHAIVRRRVTTAGGETSSASPGSTHTNPTPGGVASCSGYMLCVSAKSLPALKDAVRSYNELLGRLSLDEERNLGAHAAKNHLQLRPQLPLSLLRICRDSCVRRTHFRHRIAVPCPTDRKSSTNGFGKMQQCLRSFLDTTIESPWYGRHQVNTEPKPLAFLFGGAGSLLDSIEILQHGLDDQPQDEPTPLHSFATLFAKSLRKFDAVAAAVGLTSFSTTSVLSAPNATHILRSDREIGAVCLLGAELALADAFATLGIHPTVVVGYSLGEIAAATISGAITVAEAIMLARLTINIARTSGLEGKGHMLAASADGATVRAVVNAVRQETGGRLCVAGENSPDNTTISGDSDAMDLARKKLTELGIASVVVDVGAAYHCIDVFQQAKDHWDEGASFLRKKAIVEDYNTGSGAEVAGRLSFDASTPRPVFYSACPSFAGHPMDDSQLRDPAYWWRVIADRVDFQPAVFATKAAHPDVAFLELSPRSVLAPFVSSISQAKGSTSATVLPTPMLSISGKVRRYDPIAATLCSLHTQAHCRVDFARLYGVVPRSGGHDGSSSSSSSNNILGPSVAHTLPRTFFQRRFVL